MFFFKILQKTLFFSPAALFDKKVQYKKAPLSAGMFLLGGFLIEGSFLNINTPDRINPLVGFILFRIYAFAGFNHLCFAGFMLVAHLDVAPNLKSASCDAQICYKLQNDAYTSGTSSALLNCLFPTYIYILDWWLKTLYPHYFDA